MIKTSDYPGEALPEMVALQQMVLEQSRDVTIRLVEKKVVENYSGWDSDTPTNYELANRMINKAAASLSKILVGTEDPSIALLDVIGLCMIIRNRLS